MPLRVFNIISVLTDVCGLSGVVSCVFCEGVHAVVVIQPASVSLTDEHKIILVCAVILYIIVNIPQISDFIGKVNDLIAPIVIGLIIAYLCNPILKFYEFVVFKKLVKNHPRLCRALSLILMLITVLLAITLILLLIIPELIESITDFFAKAEDYINDFLSVINNILSKMVKNNNWNFGANISPGDEGFYNAEYEGLLNGSMLNNRLLFNGQFGYRDKATATNQEFIGDFDLRYMLFPNGNFAVRAYNMTNDRYFVKNSQITQGLGLILKYDFNTFRALFSRKKDGKKTAAGKK